MNVCRATTVAAVAALTLAGAAHAAVARHTRVQAERNVLHAHRVLRRLDARLVDPRTGLPRTDTVVSCSGRGRAVHGRRPRFVCTITYHRVRVTVLYLAQNRNGFELRHLTG